MKFYLILTILRMFRNTGLLYMGRSIWRPYVTVISIYYSLFQLSLCGCNILSWRMINLIIILRMIVSFAKLLKPVMPKQMKLMYHLLIIFILNLYPFLFSKLFLKQVLIEDTPEDNPLFLSEEQDSDVVVTDPFLFSKLFLKQVCGKRP